MPKAKTLREQAEEYANRVGGRDPNIRDCLSMGYLAGHRANRLTKAQRAVVEAAKAYAKETDRQLKFLAGADLERAVSALERAKGRQ